MEAAFFDVDKTVIAKASMAVFGRTLYREGLISRRTVLRGLWAQLVYLHLGAGEEKLARIRESVLTLTRGWDQAKVRQLAREAMEGLVEPIIYGEALELIESHRTAGHQVYIVSASPEEIVGPLATYLGVDGAISSKAKIDENGRYTGEMEFYSYGPYKVDAIRALADREGIDLAASYAYSDSYTDLPMLEAVGNPVAVNPDRVLLKLARERDWEVRNFVRPVSLRPRVGAPGLPAAAVAGAVVMGVGGVVGWRLGLRRRRQPVSLPAASWQQRLREQSARPVSAASSWLPNLPAGWLHH
jgi:HAD superfamily hydrolase (TIGR01490 family)